MKQLLIFSFFLFSGIHFSQEKINYQQTSQQLLQQIINKNSYENELNILSKSTLDELTNHLKTDQEKIAFWVNIYNSFIQISLTKNPDLYKNRTTFFSEKRVKIAGVMMSFDDIEHGILRKSQMKISLGYLKKFSVANWEQKMRVNEIDWRIHFALNCGAKSCPPVAIYTPENLENEFDFMTKAYLKEQTSYDSKTKTANSVVLFSWFRGDFGGINGAKKILYEYKITTEIPEKLDFKEYDWTIFLGNFRKIPK